jgi:hypothetical protein
MSNPRRSFGTPIVAIVNASLWILPNAVWHPFALTGGKLNRPSSFLHRNDPCKFGFICRAWADLGNQMKNYSIVRIGNEYVVRAEDKSVLKVASRRRAAQLVSNAVELLNSLPPGDAPPICPEQDEAP